MCFEVTEDLWGLKKDRRHLKSMDSVIHFDSKFEEIPGNVIFVDTCQFLPPVRVACYWVCVIGTCYVLYVIV